MSGFDLNSYVEKISAYGSVLGLESIETLCNRLSALEGSDICALSAIHIAGTNGKGSVGSMIASILAEAGYKVGHFSSPAVFSYEEMIRVNGESIIREELALLYREIEEVCQQMTNSGLAHPTLFEIETAAALLYFHRSGCAYAVIECGMGGSTDATNVLCAPKLCVFTSIDVDHTRFLGNSKKQIAQVKAGIMKEKVACVSAMQSPEVLEVLRDAASKNLARLQVVDPLRIQNHTFAICEDTGRIRQHFRYQEQEIQLPLAGGFQVENAALACEAISSLGDRKVTQTHIKEGLRKVSWPGRLESLGKTERGAYLYVDGAHNPAAANKLKESIRLYFTNKKILFIMGVLADKDYKQILEILIPVGSGVITVTPDNQRALPAKDLAQTAVSLGFDATAAADVHEALNQANLRASQGDVIIAFGSLSYLKDIKQGVHHG